MVVLGTARTSPTQTTGVMRMRKTLLLVSLCCVCCSCATIHWDGYFLPEYYILSFESETHEIPQEIEVVFASAEDPNGYSLSWRIADELNGQRPRIDSNNEIRFHHSEYFTGGCIKKFGPFKLSDTSPSIQIECIIMADGKMIKRFPLSETNEPIAADTVKKPIKLNEEHNAMQSNPRDSGTRRGQVVIRKQRCYPK